MGQFTTLTAADGFTLSAYVATPEGKPRAAIVVLQEIFGVNSHIRSVADRFAAEGYLAVAPATFDRVKPGVELGYTEDDMKAGFELKTAVDALPGAGRAAGHPGGHRPCGAAQRRQGRHRRLLLGRPADLEVRPACSAACPLPCPTTAAASRARAKSPASRSAR